MCRFEHYNPVLRGFPRWALDACKGNRYVTTIHTINSAIVKTSKLTEVARVYRGVAGGVLPDAFFTPNEQGVRGGVEKAFLSTTFERTVAMDYASAEGKPSIVFEIQSALRDVLACIQLHTLPHCC